MPHLSWLVVAPLLVAAAPRSQQLRWQYSNPPQFTWITESVAVGYGGTLAWLGQGAAGQRLSLLSTTERNPPVPIYERPLEENSATGVAAARRAPVCVVGDVPISGGTAKVRYFTAFSPVPVQTHGQTRVIGLSITDDGSLFAAGDVHPTGLGAVRVYELGQAQPRITLVVTSGAISNGVAISGDGSTLLATTLAATQVFDAATGVELFSAPLANFYYGFAIDFAGDTWMRTGPDVGIWTRAGGTYQRTLTFSDPSGSFLYGACAISRSGTTAVAGAFDRLQPARMAVYCFDLRPPGPRLLWTFDYSGAETYQNVPSALSLSDDGRWIALGSWGAQLMSQPEVLVFDRDAGNVPIASLDTPGSVLDVDISGDGQFVVAGAANSHANFGTIPGGAAFCLDRGGQSFCLFGTPSVGRSVTLTVDGHPGEQAYLAASPSLGPGLSIPGFSGSYGLGPSPFPVLSLGAVPAAGILSVPVSGFGPSLLGLTVYAQTVRVGAASSFDNTLAIPITP